MNEKFVVADIFRELHEEIPKGYFVSCHGQFGADSFDVDFMSPVGDLRNLGVKTLNFVCRPVPTDADSDSDTSTSTCPKSKDAFHLLMAKTKERGLPKPKTSI